MVGYDVNVDVQCKLVEGKNLCIGIMLVQSPAAVY